MSGIQPGGPSDDAYDAVTWDDSQVAPTQNAIRDLIETLGVGGAATVFTVIQVLHVSGIFAITGDAVARIREGGSTDKVTIVNTATVSGSGQFTIGATATVEVIH